AQDIIPVDHTYSVKEMAAAGKNVEKNVLAKALKLVFEERCFVYGNRTVVLT
ncbi:MAG: formyltetrahydrofolate deformylase, partial [Bacteroidota bacterium]